MFKKNKGFRKKVTGRFLSFLLALTVIIMPLSTSFSTTAQAAAITGSAITLENAAISNANHDVTLTFNVRVQGSQEVEDWRSLIEVKGSNDGAFNSITNYGGDAWISDTGAVVVHFNYSSLIGNSNQIRVKAGALVGSLDSNYTVTSDQVSVLIAAQDVTVPHLDSTAISSDLKNVTLTFNTTVQTATYSVTSVTYNVDLYDFVKIKTMYDDSDYIRLSNDNTISVNGNKMVIAFAAPLSGYKSIQVLNGAVKGANSNVNDTMYADLNTEVITYSNHNLYNYNSDLGITFSQGVVNNMSDDALKAAITISKDDGAYTALGLNDKADVNKNLQPFSINRIGNGSFNLHFFTPLAPGSYKVKIAANALKSSIGLVAGELTTASIVARDITAPVYQSSEVSADHKVVTLTFDKTLVNVTQSCPWCGIQSLSDNIYIEKSENGYFQQLRYIGGTVELLNNKMIVTLNSPLTGTNNKIAIRSGALKDESGNVLNTGVVTKFIDVATIAPPRYLHSSIDNLNHDWTLFFDKNVKINTASVDDLKAAIKLSIHGVEKSIESSTTVTFIDNKVVLHFAAPLVDNNIEIHIEANVVADTHNNALTDPITTEQLTPHNMYPPEFSRAYLITSHTVELYFYSNNETDMVDNTVDTAGSHLKEYVTYSTDKGATFLPLQPGDGVTITNGSLYVYFHNVIQGNLQIKIAGNALKETYGNVLTTSVITGDIDTNYTPRLTGSFFSNVPSVLTFEDNAIWRSKIQKVVLSEAAYNWSERILSPDQYTITAGKLTILPGVLEQEVNYRVIIYADGFNDRYTDNMKAIRSQDSYYITPVKMEIANGITAKMRIAQNQSNGHLHVIFQLMNGQLPVSIVAAESDYFQSGTFTANFNVADATTNPNYKVRAFVVSEYSNSQLSVGVNLATSITDAEYDVIQYQND
jgi:hypothetical protein